MKRFYKFLMPLVMIMALALPWNTRAQATVEIGTDQGTTTNSYLPMYTLYNNTLSEQIYTADEIGMAGTITSVAFYNGGETKTVSAKIYMINTSRTDFSSTTDWLPVTASDLVFDGTVTFTAGQWTTITLDNPFMYDGASNLGLIFDGNLNWSSGLACRVFDGTTNCAMYVYSDPTDYNAVGATYTASDRLSVKNQLKLEMLPANMSCYWPINLAISGVDSNEATLSWGDTNGATTWRVYWAPADTPALIDSIDVNDSTYTFTGLNANTLYNVSVMTVCDTSNSIAMSTSFRTLCGITTAPFTEGFEGRTTGDVPYCWTQFATGTSSAGTFPSIYNYASNARTGSAYFEFESTSGQTEVVSLPSVDNLTGLRLRFYAACTNHNFVLEAGVMEDTDFVVVDTVQLTTATSFGSNAYHEYTVYYNNYNGMGNRMAMRVTAAGSYTLMIDDLTVEEIPACPDPTYFVVDSVGTDWAALSWVENGSASEWIIEYDTVPFTPGATATTNSETASDTYITLTNLDTGYTYYVYLHADCGGDTSQNIFLQFNTLAGDPATVPYSCGFEDANTNGWEFANGTQTNHWMVGNATNHGGSKALYVTNDGSANAYTITSTSHTYAYRIFNLTEPGEYAYSYDWKCQGESHYYDFSRAFITPATEEFVGGSILGDGTYAFSSYACPANWIEITAQTGATPNTMSQSSSWTTVTGTFTITTPGNYKMVFVWTNDGGGGSQPPMAVDNISLNLNTCPAPTNLTVNVSGDTANFAWTDALGSNWDLVYVPEGTAPSDDAAIAVSSTSYEATDLDDGFYNAYVRTNCGNDDVSLWTGPVNFNVGVTVMNMAAGNDTLYSCAATIYDDGGPNGSYSTDRDDQLIIYPTDSTKGIIISGTSYTEGSWDYLRIYAGAGVSGTQLWNDYGTSATQNFGPFEVEGPVTVTFHSDGSVVYDGFEINIGCYDLPDCPTPTYVGMTDISNNVATVTLGSNISSEYNEMVIYWGTANDIALADSATITAGTTTYTITGLTGSTTYYVWVKGVCSDYSRAISTSFTTTPDCMPVENLRVAGTDYHAFGLMWNAPTAGFPATQYIVSWKHANASTWTSDTTTNTYYYVSGLGMDSAYQYRVTTICDSIVSALNSGSVATNGCGLTIGDGSSTYSYLPTYTFYNYSYTQQIYLDNELNGIDSIASIAFYTTGNPSRTIRLLMGNTTQSSFSTTSNFIPVTDLDTVYEGQLSGSGWITLNLTHPFVRTAGSNLVVATDDNTGSYVSSPSWSVNSASSRAIYFYQDASDINPTAPSASSSSVANYVNQIRLAPPTCVLPDCASPIVFVDNLTSTGMNVVWNTESGLSYEVAYQIAGDSTWTVVDAANTTGNTIIDNLTPGLDLVVRVSTDCNGTTLTGTLSVSTLCGAVALPLIENFERDYGIYNRSCWTVGTINLGTNYPYPYVISLTGDPNKLCLIYNGGYLVLPQVAAPLDQLQIRFKFVQGGDNVHFLMGLLENPAMPINNMIVLDTLIRSDIDTSTSTVNITYSLANINPDYNNYHIAFWDAFNENYSFIDDLVVEYIPQCPPVTGLTATTTTTTATISWAAGDNNASGYIVEYGPRGFTPGTGTTEQASSTTVTLTGLNHSTNYDAYVYTACSALSDTSIASQVVQFTTECDVITTLPYSTTFEHILPPGSGSSVVMVPNCWATEVTNGTYAPRVYYTTSTLQAPSQSYCLYFSDLGVAALPQMGISLDSLQISFHAYNSTPANYGLIVGTVDSIAPGYAASFTPIDTIPFQTNVNEYNVVSYLTEYTGTANRIALKNYHADTSYDYAYIYLDDLTIDYVPSCIAPQRVHTTALTNVSADLAWRFSTAPNYSIEYGPHGFTPGTGTTLTSTTNSISLTGLTPFTQYDVRLVSLCSATETSDTTVFTFTTLRAAPVTNYPYSCDFADSTIATAWEPINGTQTNAWYVGSGAHYGTADNMAMYISDDNGVSNTYNNGSTSNVLAYRTFAMQPGSYNISFMWQAAGESCCDYLRVFLVPGSVSFIEDNTNDIGSTGAPAGWIALDGGNKLNSNSSWQNIAEDVNITTANNYHLVFFWHNDGSLGSNPPAAIDNIEVSRNVCPITNLQVDTATGSTITISWSGNSDSYQVEYGTVGFAHGTGYSTTTTATSATLTGLTSLTNYEIYVRGFCNGSDTSRWYRTVGFTGLCDNPTIAQNFNTASTETSSYSPLGTSYYNYGYVQTLIDSADMAAIGGDIRAMAFYPASTSQGNYYSNMDIYLANVPENSLASGFIQPDSTTHVFVQVLTAGNLNYTTTDEQLVSFDAPFTWDGHSNVLVVVNRKHGSYSSGASFSAHTASVAKTCYAYTDGSAYNPYNITVSGTSSTTVGNLKLISCGGGCYAPSALHTTSVTYNSVSVAWSGTDSAEVGIRQGLWDETGATITTVTTNSYTFTGLTPNTQYTVAVRTLCPDDMTSAWVYLSVTTDDLPCFAPTNVQVSNETPNGAKVTWTAGGNETEWLVNVFRSGVIDTNYTVINTPMCNVSGLYSAMTYTVKVGAVCGGIDTMWSDPATLTTTACLPPTNVNAVANGHQAIVTWESSGANEYHVLWFLEGFTTDGDSVVVTNGNTNATIDGLQGGEDYDIYVYAYCDGQRSAQAGQTQLHVTGIDDINSSAINLYPNPANTTVTVDGIEGEALVTIVDMNGRTVFSEKTVSSITIDLGGMAKGAYFVRITGENSSAIRKLIVK